MKISGQYERDKAPSMSKDEAQSYLTASATGEYKRHESGHRHFVAAGSRFEPEADRYHLHIALACPWACGVLSMLYLKGLDHVISYSIVHPTWQRTKPDDKDDDHCGWVYRAPGDAPLANPLGHGSVPCDDVLAPDTITNMSSIRGVYELSGDPRGPFTTPVLWDRKEGVIVNNESTEILRMLNSAFNHLAKHPEIDMYPVEHEDVLDRINMDIIYPKINNGVYRSGFARTQEAYDKAVDECFDALEDIEQRLSKTRFLAGAHMTWLDLRLFHTLIRFDPVYTVYFKTNVKRIADFPNLLGFVRDVYAVPSIRRSICMDHIKNHYFTSHPHLNTFAIVPAHSGPDLTMPSGRGATLPSPFVSSSVAPPMAVVNTSAEEDQTNKEQRKAAGEFVRGVSAARSHVGSEPYPVEAGRYHLYVAFNCPWCHRIALARALLGLEDIISMDVLLPVRTEDGHPQGEGKWQFLPEGLTARNGEPVQFPSCTPDTVNGKGTIVEIYKHYGNDAQWGERSVPMLFDKKTSSIVNNESSEILRMLGRAFRPLGTKGHLDLYPDELKERIDELNTFVYVSINNAAYKAGFSSKQSVYTKAFDDYFAGLDYVEELLASSTFLCGESVTEADVRLFPTIFRHDPVYHNRMKLNKKYIADFPNLWRWMCDMYALPGVAAVSPIDQMKQGYFGRTGNGTVPICPVGYPELLADREHAAKRSAA